MRVRKRRFNTSAAWLFKEAWCVDYAKAKRQTGSVKAWRQHEAKLHGAWQAYMYSVLSTTTWLALRMLLERQHDIRWLWVKPGGYFFTRAGNPRKRKRESLRPKRHIVNLDDRLVEMGQIYHEALEEEGPEFKNTLAIVTLFLAGSITRGGTEAAHVPSIERRPYKRRRKRRRLWSPTITSSLRYLRRIGFLHQPRENEPWL